MKKNERMSTENRGGGSSMSNPLRKKLDSQKIRDYFSAHPELVKAEVSRKACVNKSTIHDAIRKGEARITFWNSICDALEVDRDYFDYVEPEPVETTPLEETITTNNDIEWLKDILVSLLATGKSIESLLLKQNKILEEVKKDTPADQWNRILHNS